jgi:hypothetical protein
MSHGWRKFWFVAEPETSPVLLVSGIGGVKAEAALRAGLGAGQPSVPERSRHWHDPAGRCDRPGVAGLGAIAAALGRRPDRATRGGGRLTIVRAEIAGRSRLGDSASDELLAATGIRTPDELI